MKMAVHWKRLINNEKDSDDDNEIMIMIIMIMRSKINY